MADDSLSLRSAPFLDALLASGPCAGPGTQRDLYAELIGSWEADLVDHLPAGDRRLTAEVHFAWILEGRAVQDVWIVPARSERGPGLASAGNRCGTTVRRYDPALDAWRISWWNPVDGSEAHLVGRREAGRIVHTGTGSDGRLLRWSFVELGPRTFHWRGERSPDGGRSWISEAEFFGRRRLERAARERRLSWIWSDRPGLESLRLVQDEAGARADGRVLIVLDGTPLSVHYHVAHDPSWNLRSAEVELEHAGARRTLALARDARGRWSRDGSECPELAGCEDVDLMFSPYTNTPVLLARPLAPGGERILRAAWVTVPELAVRVAEQEYTRLGTGERYRYRNRTSGFTGELTLDPDGLVREYGPWRRA